MVDAAFNIGKGSASKLGLVGLLLTALGAAVVKFAESPCHDLACWLALGQGVFLSIGGFGVVRKLLPFLDKLGASE